MGGCNVQGKSRGMPRECMGVGAKCQENGGESHENVWEWIQIDRGMHGNGCGCSVQVMQGDAEECRGMPGERMGVGVTCQGNAGE